MCQVLLTISCYCITFSTKMLLFWEIWEENLHFSQIDARAMAKTYSFYKPNLFPMKNWQFRTSPLSDFAYFQSNVKRSHQSFSAEEKYPLWHHFTETLSETIGCHKRCCFCIFSFFLYSITIIFILFYIWYKIILKYISGCPLMRAVSKGALASVCWHCSMQSGCTAVHVDFILYGLLFLKPYFKMYDIR